MASHTCTYVSLSMRWRIDHCWMLMTIEAFFCVLAEFLKKFTPHVSSTLSPPNFPSDFLPKVAKDAEAAQTVPEKLTLNFYLPHETTLKDSKVSLHVFAVASTLTEGCYVKICSL